ncbi:MAG TPA: hypothetical protein VLY46_12490 [Usitatibacter sp.]|nr:hypothetical protein [Usitatibacter sp.]
MTVGPRAKLVLIAALFAAPIVASYLTYYFGHAKPTANHGELLLPPQQESDAVFRRPDGRSFSLRELRGRWILVAQDAGKCDERCLGKLVVMRQVRLALGRDAERVERVLLVDADRAPDPSRLAPFPGMEVATGPRGSGVDTRAAGDLDHVYLVDPNGNVMMRWRSTADPKGMLQDLQRLLSASQIG